MHGIIEYRHVNNLFPVFEKSMIDDFCYKENTWTFN